MPTSSKVSSSPSPKYRNLMTELQTHTWVLIIYLVGCVGLSYLLGFASSSSTIFAAAEIPTVCMAVFVLRRHRRLRVRVPFVWCVTAVFIWTIPRAVTDGIHFNRANEIAALSLVLLFGHWLIRGIIGSITEVNGRNEDEFLPLVANLTAIWGATLISVRLVWPILQQMLAPIIEPTDIGKFILIILTAAQSISLWDWFPPGLLLLGLALFAAVRLKDDPYEMRQYSEVLPRKLPPVLNELATALRLPAWICIIVFGFLVHFVKQMWICSIEFIDKWLGRMALILGSLVIPTILISVAHYTALSAMEGIAYYLSGQAATTTGKIFFFFAVHFDVLVSMCLYVIAVVSFALEIAPHPVGKVLGVMKGFIFDIGIPAALAVGGSFSLYGALFIAVPIASILPGGPGIGLFSITYTVIVLSVVAYVIITSRTAKEPHPTQR